MDGAGKTPEQLLAELAELRRQVAALEAFVVEQQRTEQRLVKETLASGEALQKSEATGRALLELASEGILLVDTNGLITLVNAAAERMFGYRRDELLAGPSRPWCPSAFAMRIADIEPTISPRRA
jgi:PAS domain-containing protein